MKYLINWSLTSWYYTFYYPHPMYIKIGMCLRAFKPHVEGFMIMFLMLSLDVQWQSDWVGKLVSGTMICESWIEFSPFIWCCIIKLILGFRCTRRGESNLVLNFGW